MKPNLFLFIVIIYSIEKLFCGALLTAALDCFLPFRDNLDGRAGSGS